MKQVRLIHNPGAGDENHSEKDLKKLLEKYGYECSYASIKQKGWKDFDMATDILLIAGGDGTIRKVVEEILDENLIDRPGPLALLPLGTANNISLALGLVENIDNVVQSWNYYKTKSFDVGRIYHVEEAKFFLESFGFGIFPYLMKKMKELDKNPGSPDQKIRQALETLYDITQDYEAKYCKLEIDGTDHSGKFILAEIMNTPSIGPNLVISPLSDPGDGELEVVLVPEQQKSKFSDYIKEKIEGRENAYSFHTLKGRYIRISWEGTHVHVDDQLVKLKEGTEVSIRVKKGLLDFLVSG